MNIQKLLSQLQNGECDCGKLFDTIKRKLDEAKKDESFTLAENVRLEKQIEASTIVFNAMAEVANIIEEAYAAAITACHENDYPLHAEAFERVLILGRWLRERAQAINAETEAKKKEIHAAASEQHE